MLFPLFATGFIDTGGKFSAGAVDVFGIFCGFFHESVSP